MSQTLGLPRAGSCLSWAADRVIPGPCIPEAVKTPYSAQLVTTYSFEALEHGDPATELMGETQVPMLNLFLGFDLSTSASLKEGAESMPSPAHILVAKKWEMEGELELRSPVSQKSASVTNCWATHHFSVLNSVLLIGVSCAFWPLNTVAFPSD